MPDWENTFRRWAEGPGDTETDRCENVERMIRKAIAASTTLAPLDIEVFSQGSFRNVTNIPQESDVDVSVCLRSSFFYRLPHGHDVKNYPIWPATNDYATYRKDVTAAITSHFGRENVTPGNKAIRIHENSYRVDADVVPNWLYKYYYSPTDLIEGVKFYAVDGTEVINYPKQHIKAAVVKNSLTSKRFKRLSRILKSLQIDMLDEKDRHPSFFLESLLFNVPNDKFGHRTYTDDVREVIRAIYHGTKPEDNASEWLEANGIKYLFHASQPWTKADANAFALAAWRYLGFQ